MANNINVNSAVHKYIRVCLIKIDLISYYFIYL